MKTKEVYVSNDGTGRDEALEVVEQYSFSRGFDKKPRLHARLLAEELLGMVYEITGKFYAYFWVEDNDTAYMLHLSVWVRSAMPLNITGRAIRKVWIPTDWLIMKAS